MDIVSTATGVNIVSQCYALPPVYSDPSVPCAYVEIYWRARNADEPATAWKYEDIIGPTGTIEIHYDPDIDRDVEVAPMPYSANGTPAFATIDDAFDTIGRVLPHQRETEAPEIGQNAPATPAQVQIGITGFTRFARLRRITISAHPDMSDPLDVLLFDSDDYAAKELPRYCTLERNVSVDLTTEAGAALTTEGGDHLQLEVLPATIYISVSHSSGRVWTPESNILEVMFAGESTPGSAGSFDPTPRDSGVLNGL
jgi:hypothetical protein